MKASRQRATGRGQQVAEPVGSSATPTAAPDWYRRWQRIAEAAYIRAERRGFRGDPIEDWLAAEAEVDGALAGRVPRQGRQA
jgi:hypothetical protein